MHRSFCAAIAGALLAVLPAPRLDAQPSVASSASAPVSAVPATSAAIAAWTPVYKHDAQGRPLGGSKARLVEAIRQGQDVRVAWGVRHPRDSTRSVEHTAPARFTTIVDGAEVFVQVAEHVAYADYWARDEQSPGDPQLVWSAVLGTTGAFNAVWYNRASGAEVRRLPQRVTMTWLVQGAANSTEPDPAGRAAPPLWAPEPPRFLVPEG